MWTCPQCRWVPHLLSACDFSQFPVRQRHHITDTIFLCSNTQESKVEKKEGIYYMHYYLDLPWDSLRTAQHKAAIRNGDMDYAVARQYKEKNHWSASSLRFVGIKRVKANPRGGNLKNQLLRREAFFLLNPADSVRHRVWVVFPDVYINWYVFFYR